MIFKTFLLLSLDFIQVQVITFNFCGSQDGYTIANSPFYKLHLALESMLTSMWYDSEEFHKEKRNHLYAWKFVQELMSFNIVEKQLLNNILGETDLIY